MSDPTWKPGDSSEPVQKRGEFARAKPNGRHEGGPYRELGLPVGVPPHEHPEWPRFKRWADDRLGGNCMLGVYWDCWLAASREDHE